MTTNNTDNNGLDKLIKGLKSEDSRNEKISRRLQWLYWGLLPIYISFLVFNPGGEFNSLDRIGFGCYIVGFISFAFLFRYNSKDYKNVDYSIATIEMLKKAAKRYKLFQKSLLLVIVPVIAIGAGMVLSTGTDGELILKNILLTQAMYWGAITLGFCIGVVIWFKRSKPLRDHALDLIKEIES